MKKNVIFCLLCVIFCLIFTNSSSYLYCSAKSDIQIQDNVKTNESFEFHYQNKIFTYDINKNILKENIFYEHILLNSHNRFGNIEQRKALLQKLLSLGIDENIAIEYLFPNISKTINKIEKTINTQPKNATIKINSNKENPFTISKEHFGIEVDKNKLISNIIRNYLSNQKLEFKIPTKTLKPEKCSKDFKKCTNLRGEFSTNIANSNNERKHNIKNALNRLNLVEIFPNQEFSFNNTVGKRTKENGYMEAKIIVNNEFVEGFGGGVCQVASTLYNAALLSGLQITEANKHSKQVSYVKYGFDAMVNFGTSDLRFKNNTKEKLTIIANYSPQKIRIRIYGENLNGLSYKLSNEITNKTQAQIIEKTDILNEYQDKVLFDDEFFFLKTPQNGMEVKSYLETYKNGTLQQKKLLRFDKFIVQDGIKIYGTKKRTEEENSVHF